MDAETDVAVEVLNAGGMGEVCLLCEHASAHIPAEFDDLGLRAEHRLSHAVWDPGARDLAVCLSAALDAPLVASRLSRLLYDCNRPPEAPSATAEKSELIEVPSNRQLSDDARKRRVDLSYVPFCRAVSELLEARRMAGLNTVIVTVHSFSPTYFEQLRSVEIGVLHDSDTKLADAMLAHTGELPERVVRRNEPYGPDDGVTHSLQLHAISNGLSNVMLEVRNDMLTDAAKVKSVCAELTLLLKRALADLHESSCHA